MGKVKVTRFCVLILPFVIFIFFLCSFCLHMSGVILQRLAFCCRCSCQPPPHNPCGATVFRQSGCAPLRVSVFRNMEVCMGFLPFFCSSSSLHSFPLGFTIWGMYLFFFTFWFPLSVVFATEMVISYYRYSDKSATEKKICQFGGLLHGRQYTHWQQFTPRHEPEGY